MELTSDMLSTAQIAMCFCMDTEGRRPSKPGTPAQSAHAELSRTTTQWKTEYPTAASGVAHVARRSRTGEDVSLPSARTAAQRLLSKYGLYN